MNLEQLSKTVDVRIINLVGLCLHLNALLTMKPVDRKRITDEQVKKIILDYPQEYAFVLKFTGVLEETLHMVLGIEETVLLTMFIIEPEKAAHHPVLLYAMHGRGVAKYLAETTNMLTQEKNTYAFDMDLSSDTKQAMEELEEMIVTIDEGADRDRLIKEVMELKKTYRIHAFVGIFDPQLFGIPFIAISDIFESNKEDIDRVLMFEPVQKSHEGYETVIINWEEQLTHISVDKLRKVLPKCVDELVMAYGLQEDEKIGLFAHMVSLLDCLASPDYVCKNNGEDAFIRMHKDDYYFVSKLLKTLEKQFKVIINDTEMGIILRVLTREK